MIIGGDEIVRFNQRCTVVPRQAASVVWSRGELRGFHSCRSRRRRFNITQVPLVEKMVASPQLQTVVETVEILVIQRLLENPPVAGECIQSAPMRVAEKTVKIPQLQTGGESRRNP